MSPCGTNSNAKPVFVVGCPRSGTTLLYDMILSSGDFALFPAESHAFDIVGKRFPDLASLKSRKRLLEFFLQTKTFAVTGLARAAIEPKVLNGCLNIGDFLRIVMEEMRRKQGARRWVEKTPNHILYIGEIKRLIPDALIIHIIRDGRDTALSMANMHLAQDAPLFMRKVGPSRVYPLECGGRLLASGVRWRWMVRNARAAGKEIGSDYYELRYEDLVQEPRETLAKLGDVIGHDLDYDRILRAGVGAVRQPDTSFPGQSFNPVGRWKKLYSPDELAKFEAAVGDCLEELGYALVTDPQERRNSFSVSACRVLGVSQLSLKYWLKLNTPLGRLAGSGAEL
jgi:sulfotransferase family protein